MKINIIFTLMFLFGFNVLSQNYEPYYMYVKNEKKIDKAIEKTKKMSLPVEILEIIVGERDSAIVGTKKIKITHGRVKTLHKNDGYLFEIDREIISIYYSEIIDFCQNNNCDLYNHNQAILFVGGV